MANPPTSEQFSQQNCKGIDFQPSNGVYLQRRVVGILFSMHKKVKRFNYLVIEILRFKLEYFIRNGYCISLVSNLVFASPIWVFMCNKR